MNNLCISQILNIAYAEDTNTDSYFRGNQEFTTSYCYFVEFKFNLIYNFQFGSFNNYIQFQAVFFAYGFIIIIIILCSLVITFMVFIQAQE